MGVAVNHAVYFGEKVPQAFFYVVTKPGTMGEADGEVTKREDEVTKREDDLTKQGR